MSIIIDTVLGHLPLSQKKTPSGWISFNCIACTHVGSSNDTRKRAGVHVNTDGISYSCFNCGFKASWSHGKPLSKKFKKLLEWLHVSNDELLACIRESLMLKDGIIQTVPKPNLPKFYITNLPIGARPIHEWINENNTPSKLIDVLHYMQARGLYLDDYNWYWTDNVHFNDRIIIPFTYKNEIVGYTGRTIHETNKNRYISEQQPGYVFNIDSQPIDRKFVIVVEGPLDAICIDGISLLGSKVSGGQELLINQLQREVIVLPDRDKAGKKLIETALEHNWSVSFPDWENGITDVNDAILHYGRLYTLYSIIKGRVSSPTVINVKQKIWFNI